MKEKVAQFAKQYLKEDVPPFKVGDTVAASVRIIEGSKERIQVFQGVCIARRHSGIDETFTIRKISFQIGVERTFFLNSPRLAGLEVKRRGRVRRSKLYYLRDRVGKARRVKELRTYREK